MRRSFGGAALAATLVAHVAHAQPNAADVSRAVTLFDDAKRALAAGDTPEACHLFVESYRLDPQVGTLLNTALCHEKAGRTASAWAEFMSVHGLATRAGQVKRAEFARSHAKALEPKLVRVRFEVREPSADLAVTVDGESIAAPALRLGPFPMDPGTHELVASAPKKKPWRGTLVVPASGDGGSHVIPKLEDEVETPAPAPPPPRNPAPVAPAPDPPSSGLRTAAWVAAAGAGAGLVTGGVMGLLALSAQSTADEGCGAFVCRDQASLDANDRAITFASVSTIGFIAGAALAVGSTVLFLVSRKPSAPSATANGFVVHF